MENKIENPLDFFFFFCEIQHTVAGVSQSIFNFFETLPSRRGIHSSIYLRFWVFLNYCGLGWVVESPFIGWIITLEEATYFRSFALSLSSIFEWKIEMKWWRVIFSDISKLRQEFWNKIKCFNSQYLRWFEF